MTALLVGIAVGLGLLVAVFAGRQAGGVVGLLGLAAAGLYLWLTVPPSTMFGGVMLLQVEPLSREM